MESGRLLEIVLQASWQASIGLMVLLGLRLLAGRMITGRWLHVLWMLVIIRLLVPGSLLPEAPKVWPVTPPMPLAGSFEPIGPKAIGYLETMSRQGDVQITVRNEVVSEPTFFAMNWWSVAAGIWMTGAGVLGCYLLTGSFWLSRRIRSEQMPTPEKIARVWELCCAQYSPRRRPRLVTSRAVGSPVLHGLLRPWLVLPAQALEALSEDDWKHVFLHELTHYRRRDTCANGLQLMALCLHWFNPLLWLCQSAIRADRELATDERVLGQLGSERRAEYGETLVRVLSSTGRPQPFPAAIGIVEGGSGMKRRVRRILGFRKARLLLTVTGVFVLAGVALVTFGQEERKKAAPDKIVSDQEAGPSPSRKLQDDMLAAARRHDAREIRRLKTEAAGQEVYLDAKTGQSILDKALGERDPASFTVLLDELRRGHAGKDWQPSVSQLGALLAEGRKDFIDELLKRRLNLDLLTEASAKTGGPVHEWTTTRLDQVKRQRADEDALVEASRTGDIAAITRLLDSGVDIDCVGRDAFTPLTRAAAAGKADAVRLLLARGALVDKPKHPGWDYTPLCLAYTVEVATLLKAAGADVNARLFGRNEHIITYVARWASPDVVKWFLDQGVDIHHVTEDKFEPTLLFSAGAPGTAELIINRGVDLETPNEQGRTALFHIANYVKEPAKTIEVLLKHGANPNARDKYGDTPLMFAPDAATVEALVKAGADVQARNDAGDTVLRFIGNKAKPDRVEALHRLKVATSGTEEVNLLKDAILRRDIETTKILLGRGVDPDGESKSYQQYADETPMSQAVTFGAFDLADEMRRAGAKDVGLLSQAAAQGDVERMRQLLKEGANVEERTKLGATPLFFAVRQGHMKAVQLLLENGANSDAASGYGWTPVLFSESMNVQMQSPEGQRFSPIHGRSIEEVADFYQKVTPLLEARSSNKDLADSSGETVLTRAAAAGNPFAISYLKKRGADLNYQRPDGLTPLMIAIVTKPERARLDMVTQIDPKTGDKRSTSIAANFVEMLLAAGADPSIRNHEGKTALDLARERGDAEIAAILENPPKSQ